MAGTENEKTRITFLMTMHTAAQALKAVGKKEVEWGDTDTRGLCVRIRKTGAVWAIRGRLGPKKTIWVIGQVGGEKGVSLTEARARAQAAKNLLKNGTDPKAYLLEKLTGAAVERTFRPEIDGLTWPQARDEFLEFIRKNRAIKTLTDYRNTLKAKDLEAWDTKLLKQITPDDVRRVQKAIFDRGKITQAHKTLVILKSAFAWLVQNPDAAITDSPAAPVAKIDAGRLYNNKKKEGNNLGRVPEVTEIGRLGWGLAEARQPSARLAGALILFTTQRIETVLSAEKSEFTELHDGGLWSIPAAHNKGKRDHVIPLPPIAWHIVQTALAIAKADKSLLFPQTKVWKKGMSDDGHLSYGAVRDALGGEVKPHDIRRALGTHGQEQLGFLLSDSATILQHAEGRGDSMTAQKYALGNREHFKWRIMVEWQNWVLAQIAAAAPGDLSAPAFLTPPLRLMTTAAE